jgi:phenylalanyl-tRNA synthetase beta chain
MKVSYNWLQQYIFLNEEVEKVAEWLTQTGLEVEGVEEFSPVKGGLEGLVIGEVLEAGQHPNADRLKTTTVDVGRGEPLPIVCGAPNVAAGQKVVVATPGTTLYPSNGEPFKIKKSKIRGEISQGMICAEDEIGLGENHDGIMVLDTPLKPGTPATAYFNVEQDHVIEIGLTPNRADAASHIGVARDLKALLQRKLCIPDTDSFRADSTSMDISVQVENSEACPRYSGVSISNIKVGPSPEWLQNRLRAIGLSPINNIVDITNFVLHETGQPLHAFDADKITGNRVIVKTLPEGSVFTTLDEKERKLTGNDLMICNAEEGMCIAGVFGGIRSGVTEQTTRIFIESAYFAPDYIRKTSQHHLLKTDAAYRYERGTDPNGTLFALKRAALLIKELAGGEIASEIVDVYPKPIQDFRVPVKYSHVHRLIGKTLEKATIHHILNDLDIQREEETSDGFTAVVPPYRVDVTREADIIEEILRIYGYDNVEIREHMHTNFVASFPEITPGKARSQVSLMLMGQSYLEMMNNSLTRADRGELIGREAYTVPMVNPLSEDQAVMRQEMVFSGLESVAYNVNRRQKDLKLFEFGKTYETAEKGYKENSMLALFISGSDQEESWIRKSDPVHFHSLLNAVEQINTVFHLQAEKQIVSADKLWDYGLQFIANNVVFAEVGKVRSGLCEAFEIDQPVFYARLYWDAYLALAADTDKRNDRKKISPVSKYPEVRRDLSLVVHKNYSFRDIEAVIASQKLSIIRQANVFDVYEGKNIAEGHKAYAISFILRDDNKTLTDKAIDKIMQKLITAFEKELNASIRK